MYCLKLCDKEPSITSKGGQRMYSEGNKKTTVISEKCFWKVVIQEYGCMLQCKDYRCELASINFNSQTLLIFHPNNLSDCVIYQVAFALQIFKNGLMLYFCFLQGIHFCLVFELLEVIQGIESYCRDNQLYISSDC